MLPDEHIFNACEIHSHPAVTARPAAPQRNQPARRERPARRGILRIGKTQFYRNLHAGKFPKPDVEVNGRPGWTGRLLNAVLYGNWQADGDRS